MADIGRRRRVIYNEDGDTLGGFRKDFHGSTMSVQDYLGELFDPVNGTHVDTYVCCAGATHGLNFSSSGGGNWIENHRSSDGKFENLHNWRAWTNLNRYLDAGENPPELITRTAHDCDMEMFFSLRMNDAHDAMDDDVFGGPVKKDHQDWLIGEPGVVYEDRSIAWWMRKAFNYADAELREYVISLVNQLTGFRNDGVELDFMSHPFVFRIGEEREHAPLLTDMVRKVKSMLDGNGQLLMIRVPGTIARCERIGIDVTSWIREGLVDILSLGRSLTPASIPTEEWVREVAGTRCQVFPSVNPNHHAKLWRADSLRAFATQHLRDGAHGVYLFNFFLQPFSRTYKEYFGIDQIGWEALREIGDLEALEGRDKLYFFDYVRKETPNAYGHAVPVDLVDLPLELSDQSTRGTVRFRIGDSLDRTASSQIELRIEIANLSELDELQLSINDHRLVGEHRSYSYQYGCDVAYRVSPASLNTGANLLEFAVTERNPYIEPPLIVEKAEVSIRYQ